MNKKYYYRVTSTARNGNPTSVQSPKIYGSAKTALQAGIIECISHTERYKFPYDQLEVWRADKGCTARLSYSINFHVIINYELASH
jgi:hypothetical protein